jgi:methane/phenol/toluene hydroxylase
MATVLETGPYALGGHRKFVWFKPAGRLPTEYEMFTIGQQSSPREWLQVDWPLRFDDGRAPYTEESTAVRCSDWERYRDPAQVWYRPFVSTTNQEEQALDRLASQALAGGVAANINPVWLTEVLGKYYAAWPFVEYGLFLSLCYPIREALGDSVMFVLVFEATDKMRHLQDIVHLTFDLKEVKPDFSDAEARQAWMTDSVLVPTRSAVEHIFAAKDWMEVIVAINLVFEPLVGDLMKTEFMARSASRNGDPVTPIILASTRRNTDRHLKATEQLIQLLVSDSKHGDSNRRAISGWIDKWKSRVDEATMAYAPLFGLKGISAPDFGEAVKTVRGRFAAIRGDLGV